MKEISKSFDDRGYIFKQIHREGMFAIYHKKSKINEAEGYEVIRIQSHNGYLFLGVNYPPSEFYPSDSQWGVHGFSYRTKQESYVGFDKLVKYCNEVKDKTDKRKMAKNV